MKNLYNCHTIGLHSFPISFDVGKQLYRRVFYAAKNHHLWKPFELAIHPHHVDIKITVLEGELFNPLYEIHPDGEIFQKYRWRSEIKEGNGGFQHLGTEKIREISNLSYKKGESTTMKACELHTVYVEKGKRCVWLIEEEIPTCDYFPINYSPYSLDGWDTKKLYIEADDRTRNCLLFPYLEQIHADVDFMNIRYYDEQGNLLLTSRVAERTGHAWKVEIAEINGLKNFSHYIVGHHNDHTDPHWKDKPKRAVTKEVNKDGNPSYYHVDENNRLTEFLR